MPPTTAREAERPAPSGVPIQARREPDGPSGAHQRFPLPAWSRLFLLALVPLLLLGPTLLRGKHERDGGTGGRSPAPSTGPALDPRVEARRELARGALPTWNPTSGLGMPFAATDAAAWYPPNALAAALDPGVASAWLALFALLVGGAGIFAFLGRAGLAPGACVVGALAFQTSGWATAHLDLAGSVDAAVWLPWSLWAASGVARGRRGSGMLLTLASGLSFLAGSPSTATACALVVLGWAAVTGRSSRRRGGAPARFAATAVFLALGVGVGAIELVPRSEAVASSRSPAHEFSGFAGSSGPSGSREDGRAFLPGRSAAALVVPDLFERSGGPERRLAPAHLNRTGERASGGARLFVGVLVLALAAAALAGTPRRALGPLLGLLAAWGLALGWPIVRPLAALPGLAGGLPADALAVQWTLAPWLAALGVQALLERRPRAASTALVVAFALAVAAFLARSAVDPHAWAEFHRFAPAPGATPAEANRWLSAGSARVLAGALAAQIALVAALLLRRSRDAFQAGGPRLALAGALVLTALAFAAPTATTRPKLLSAPLGLTLALVAFAAGAPLRGERRDGLELWLPLTLVVALEGASHAFERVQPRELSLDAVARESRTGDAPGGDVARAVAEAAGTGRVLVLGASPALDSVAEALRARGVPLLPPHAAHPPRTLGELLLPLLHAPAFDAAHAVLDVARVTVVLCAEPLADQRLVPLADRRLVPLAERPGICAYRRSGSPPLVHVVERAIVSATDSAASGLLAAGAVDVHNEVVLAPGTKAPPQPASFQAGRVERVERPTAARLDVLVSGTSGGVLVFHEQFAPGWKASVNGRDAAVFRVDHALRGVVIPSGLVLVRTKYEPWSLRVGATVTLASLVLAGIVAWRAGRRGAA